MTKPLDTSIRISKEGYRSQSEVDAQVARYRATCARVPATEGGEVVVETDVSGTLAAEDRELGRLIAKVEDGESGGIVFPDVDRFARDTLNGLLAWQRVVEVAGGRLVFVDDGIDSGDGDPDLAKERLIDRLRNGEGYARRAGKRLAGVAREAVERGVHAGSTPPLGYEWPGVTIDLGNGRTRFKKTGPLEVTEACKATNTVAEAYAAFDAGASWSQVCRILGVRSTGAARNVLTNRVYLGEARGAGIIVPDAHPALVDEALFNRVQRKLAAAASKPRRGTGRKGSTVLAGVLKCSGCGRSLGREGGHYKCKGNPLCTCKVSVKAETAEAYLLALAIDHHAVSQAGVAMALAVDEAILPELERALISAQADRLELEAAEADVSPVAYAKALTKADAAIEDARRALDNAEAIEGWHGLTPARVAERLEGAPGETVNDFIRTMLVATVNPSGRSRHVQVADRLTVTTLVAGKTADERGLPALVADDYGVAAVEAYRGDGPDA